VHVLVRSWPPRLELDSPADVQHVYIAYTSPPRPTRLPSPRALLLALCSMLFANLTISLFFNSNMLQPTIEHISHITYHTYVSHMSFTRMSRYVFYIYISYTITISNKHTRFHLGRDSDPYRRPGRGLRLPLRTLCPEVIGAFRNI
jgi:hypothetical protein